MIIKCMYCGKNLSFSFLSSIHIHPDCISLAMQDLMSLKERVSVLEKRKDPPRPAVPYDDLPKGRKELLQQCQEAMDAESKRPPEERFRRLVDAGIIDKKGKVLSGEERAKRKKPGRKSL